MSKSLMDIVSCLPDGKVLDPLRRKIPDVYGHIHRVFFPSVFTVYIYTHNAHKMTNDIVSGVDKLFDKRGLAKFVQHRIVTDSCYSFWLIEPAGMRMFGPGTL